MFRGLLGSRRHSGLEKLINFRIFLNKRRGDKFNGFVKDVYRRMPICEYKQLKRIPTM